ncbi:MAG: RluA family pseudouridine synthase [Gammaproteobacteria bacterium]|nr:RluA family pseudouridine synthase [Gammaproteobacteria bacterium]MBU2057080.1 RluA family pseudouridine synthase [Gammaproteobacteria bacterium]MBU2175139.1 RluA family pseudouridine synthase [Gammaproteobacteria bacterium]MBU2245170.1 RluA family pseudouridine synthase [Gammaproteobacteria bacterium]MBU2343539.1 RluA family pseudouridine synthase [Gammaproteobacteria bacterium]
MQRPFVYNPPAEPWLDILYLDKDILVVNKPSGLLTNPGRAEEMQDCLLSRVQQQFPLAQLVHRLDMSTSGLVVFALRRKAEAALKQQFASRSVKKIYRARVWGEIAEQGMVNAPLIADAARPPLQKICEKTGKAALTHFQRLSFDGQSSLVELRPVTGRSHQLRVHMQSLGHPILGDAFYAHDEAYAAAPRLLLQALCLEVYQPYSSQLLRFELEPDFE